MVRLDLNGAITTTTIDAVLTPDTLSKMRSGSHIGIVGKYLGELSVDKVLKFGNIGDSWIDNGCKIHTGSQGSRNDVVHNVPVSIDPNVGPSIGIGE